MEARLRMSNADSDLAVEDDEIPSSAYSKDSDAPTRKEPDAACQGEKTVQAAEVNSCSELDSWCVGCSRPSSCPKLLTCLHTACVNCLQENTSPDGHAVCPKCKDSTPLSSGWIDGLPTNHIVKRELQRRAETHKSKPWSMVVTVSSWQ